MGTSVYDAASLVDSEAEDDTTLVPPGPHDGNALLALVLMVSRRRLASAGAALSTGAQPHTTHQVKLESRASWYTFNSNRTAGGRPDQYKEFLRKNVNAGTTTLVYDMRKVDPPGGGRSTVVRARMRPRSPSGKKIKTINGDRPRRQLDTWSPSTPARSRFAACRSQPDDCPAQGAGRCCRTPRRTVTARMDAHPAAVLPDRTARRLRATGVKLAPRSGELDHRRSGPLRAWSASRDRDDRAAADRPVAGLDVGADRQPGVGGETSPAWTQSFSGKSTAGAASRS